MNELDYMRQSLAELYDELETLVLKYEKTHAGDELYQKLRDVVHTVDGPNDQLSRGGKGYYCKGGKWHGEWQGEAS